MQERKELNEKPAKRKVHPKKAGKSCEHNVMDSKITRDPPLFFLAGAKVMVQLTLATEETRDIVPRGISGISRYFYLYCILYLYYL